MADKELRHMSRSELIEIIYAMQQQENSLRQEIEELNSKLDDKMIRMDQSGSIAEASLSLNYVFEDAQAAADEYLQSIAEMNSEAEILLEKARTDSERIMNDAKSDAEDIRAKAQADAEDIRTQAQADADEIRRRATENAVREEERFMSSVKLLLSRYPELAQAVAGRMKENETVKQEDNV